MAGLFFVAQFLRKKQKSSSAFKHYIKNKDLYNGILIIENYEMHNNDISFL